MLAKSILFFTLLIASTGCHILPVRSEKADKDRSDKLQRVRHLVSKCFESRREKPEQISLKFKVFKSGTLSSYGILEDKKERDKLLFQILKPQSNEEERACVRSAIRKVKFRLTDYRMSEEVIEIQFNL